MGKGAYIGVSNVAKKVKKMYIGVGGVAKKAKKAYIGVGGVAKLFWSGAVEGRFVYVNNATSGWSSNGTGWSQVTGLTYRLVGVCYADNKFYAVGNDYPAYSVNGSAWTFYSKQIINSAMRRVGYGGGKYIAVNNSGNLAYSTDGSTWSAAKTNPLSSGYTMQRVLYAANCYMIIISNGYPIRSTDGMNWAWNRTATSTNYDICYGGKLVIVGTQNICYSSDSGNTWTSKQMTNGNWSSVSYGNGIYVMVGANHSNTDYIMVGWSSDGISWSTKQIGSFGKHFDFVRFGNGKFVAIGINSTGGYSTNGSDWTLYTFNGYPHDMCFGPEE